MKLAETQALFWSALRGEAGSPAAQAALLACFTGTDEMPALERVGIYAGMFLWRQVDALRDDFPKLLLLLGEEEFVGLAQRYVLAEPSRHADLGQLGRGLPAFCPALLRDLAALEWARSEVFFDADLAPLASLALAPERFDEARLDLVPALRVLALAHDAPAVWAALEDGGEPGELVERPCAVVVWRTGFEVFHAEISAEEAAALRRAAAGARLAEVCGEFSTPEAALTALQSWLAEGFIAGVR